MAFFQAIFQPFFFDILYPFSQKVKKRCLPYVSDELTNTLVVALTLGKTIKAVGLLVEVEHFLRDYFCTIAKFPTLLGITGGSVLPNDDAY